MSTSWCDGKSHRSGSGSAARPSVERRFWAGGNHVKNFRRARRSLAPHTASAIASAAPTATPLVVRAVPGRSVRVEATVVERVRDSSTAGSAPPTTPPPGTRSRA